MKEHNQLNEQYIHSILEEIVDPEIPVLTIMDLGIVRKVIIEDEKVIIYITPTYSGCPAMDLISMQIRMGLISHGVNNIEIKEQLSPSWTTDWMSEAGKEKLKSYGIAPPLRKSKDPLALFENDEVPCPRCESKLTKMISGFGATSCKAMYQCEECKEPFEHFKCH